MVSVGGGSVGVTWREVYSSISIYIMRASALWGYCYACFRVTEPYEANPKISFWLIVSAHQLLCENDIAATCRRFLHV